MLCPYFIFSDQAQLKVFHIFRSSRPEVFSIKGVLRNFAKFTGKHLCQSLFFKKETLAQVFSCEFCEIYKNTFPYRMPLVAASVYWIKGIWEITKYFEIACHDYYYFFKWPLFVYLCRVNILIDFSYFLSSILSRSSHRRRSIEKDVLKNFEKFTGKHLFQSLFFNKVAGLRSGTLLKKRLWHRCFRVNFA